MHQFLCPWFVLPIAAILTGCGSLVDQPEVTEVLVLPYPGVFTCTKGDSVLVGFRFEVLDRDGVVPATIDTISIISPSGEIYSVDANAYRSVPVMYVRFPSGEWGGRLSFYEYLATVDSVELGRYVWYVVDCDGNVGLSEDQLRSTSSEPFEFDLESIGPKDSVVVSGRVQFDLGKLAPGYIFEVMIYNSLDSLVQMVRVFSLCEKCPDADRPVTFKLYKNQLEPRHWYWWSLRAWEGWGRYLTGNCCEAPSRFWFRLEAE